MALGRYRFSNGTDVITDSGNPEGSVTAPPGSLYLRTNGTVYWKASGVGNTGWTAISAASIQTLLDGISSTRGTMLYRGAAAWAGLAPGTANNILVTNGAGADPSYKTLTAIIDALIGSTQGSLLYRNATVWTPLTPGTTGQQLTTRGAAANPVFADPGVMISAKPLISATGFAPADSTTYYFGHIGAQVTSDGTRYCTCPITGTITFGEVQIVVNGTLGSAHNCTFAIRNFSTTTDANITTAGLLTAAFQRYSSSALSLAVTAGDLIELKMVTPGWTTNPDNVHIAFAFYVRP